MHHRQGKESSFERRRAPHDRPKIVINLSEDGPDQRPAPQGKAGLRKYPEIDPMSIYDVVIRQIHKSDENGDFAEAHCEALNENITISLSQKFGIVWESEKQAQKGMRVFVTGVFRAKNNKLRAKRARAV